MNRQQQDQLLTEALKRGTDGATGQRARVWRALSAKINQQEQERKQRDMKRRRNLWLTTAAAATVAAAALVFFSLTPQGTALTNQIVKFFAPEKKMDTQIEGVTGTQQAGLATVAVVETLQLESAMLETPAPTATAAPEPRKLTWDDLAIHGVKLDTAGEEAIAGLTVAIGAAPVSNESTDDLSGTSRAVKWADGTVAIVRNGKLYSIEATAPTAEVVGLHAGMTLDDFKAVLGEPHEAIGALAWGVGSNDNLIVTVEGGIVTSVKVSLVE